MKILLLRLFIIFLILLLRLLADSADEKIWINLPKADLHRSSLLSKKRNNHFLNSLRNQIPGESSTFYHENSFRLKRYLDDWGTNEDSFLNSVPITLIPRIKEMLPDVNFTVVVRALSD